MTEPLSDDYMNRLARIYGFATVAECPFCIAIASPLLKGNEHIVVLSGALVGLRAQVVPPPYPDWFGVGEVLLQSEDTSSGQYRFNQRSEIAQRVPGLDWPAWFPPISLRDAADLHVAVLQFCLHHDWDHGMAVDWQSLYGLITRVWRARLPLEPHEFGTLLQHHGLPEACRPQVVDVYRHGHALLVAAVGRRPILKKRADYTRRRARRTPA